MIKVFPNFFVSCHLEIDQSGLPVLPRGPSQLEYHLVVVTEELTTCHPPRPMVCVSYVAWRGQVVGLSVSTITTIELPCIEYHKVFLGNLMCSDLCMVVVTAVWLLTCLVIPQRRPKVCVSFTPWQNQAHGRVVTTITTIGPMSRSPKKALLSGIGKRTPSGEELLYHN